MVFGNYICFKLLIWLLNPVHSIFYVIIFNSTKESIHIVINFEEDFNVTLSLVWLREYAIRQLNFWQGAETTFGKVQ